MDLNWKMFVQYSRSVSGEEIRRKIDSRFNQITWNIQLGPGGRCAPKRDAKNYRSTMGWWRHKTWSGWDSVECSQRTVKSEAPHDKDENFTSSPLFDVCKALKSLKWWKCVFRLCSWEQQQQGRLWVCSFRTTTCELLTMSLLCNVFIRISLECYKHKVKGIFSI